MKQKDEYAAKQVAETMGVTLLDISKNTLNGIAGSGWYVDDTDMDVGNIRNENHRFEKRPGRCLKYLPQFNFIKIMALTEITKEKCPQCKEMVIKYVRPRDVTYLFCSSCATHFRLGGKIIDARTARKEPRSHRLSDIFA